MSEIGFTITDIGIPNKIAYRKAIFLDTNIWIILADESDDNAKPIKAKLRELVAEKKAFCPVSFALLLELFKQNYPSALRVASLMEELSLNISFVIESEIYNKEIDNFINSILEGRKPRLSKTDIYLPVLGFLASYGSIKFPEGFPGTEEQRRRVTNQFSDKLRTFKLTDLINSFREHLPLPKEHFPVPIKHSEIWREQWQVTKGDKRKIRQIETESAARNIFLPRLIEQSCKLPNDQRIKFFSALTAIPKDDYGDAGGTIFDSLPAIRTTIEVMTITGCDPNRKASINDVLDIQMMITPLAYADVFVARDRWIKDLLLNRSSILNTNGVKYISNLSDFETYLSTL